MVHGVKTAVNLVTVALQTHVTQCQGHVTALQVTWGPLVSGVRIPLKFNYKETYNLIYSLLLIRKILIP